MELSQYRELEAFAEFSADLDDESKAQLARGDRLMEILKQEQYQPMPVEEQIVAIFAGVENHVADVEVGDVRRFERDWLKFVREERPEILAEVRDERRMTDEIRAKLEEAVTELKGIFAA